MYLFVPKLKFCRFGVVSLRKALRSSESGSLCAEYRFSKNTLNVLIIPSIFNGPSQRDLAYWDFFVCLFISFNEFNDIATFVAAIKSEGYQARVD